MVHRQVRAGLARWMAVIGSVMLASIAAATAAPIKITFSGQLEEITTFGDTGNANLETVFSVGDTVTGSFVYDPDAAVLGGTPGTFTLFLGGISDFGITIGSSDFAASGGDVITYDDHMAGSAAPFRDGFFARGLSSVSGPSVGGVSADLLQFSLLTEDLSTVNSSGPFGLDDIVNLIAANIADGNTNFVAFEDGGTLRFGFNSISAEAIPLPGAALLFGSVLGGFAWRRRRATAS